MSPLLLFLKLINKLLSSNCLEIKQTQTTGAKSFFREKKKEKIFTIKTTKSSQTNYVSIYVYTYTHAYIEKQKCKYTYIYVYLHLYKNIHKE